MQDLCSEESNEQSRFLALLRGINVGGKNLISKEKLRQTFEDLSFSNVRTYIQSGNILFRSNATNVKELTKMIENELCDRFSYEARAIVLSHDQYKSAVQAAPEEWGKNDLYRYNALFTLEEITAEEVLAQLPPIKKGIETVTAGPGVVFWSVSKKQVTRASMMKLPSEAVYQQMTVRNHNTVFKLLELFEEI